MAKIGRNAPCPCGSGRKYKKCCLAKTEAIAAETARETPESETGSGDDSDAAFDRERSEQELAISRIAAYDEVEKRLPKSLRKKAAPLLRQMREIAEIEIRQPEIEAAQDHLEAYRNDYEDLVRDPAGFLKRARTLFAEPVFDSMRLAKAELEGAFKSVGYPPVMEDGKRFIKFAGDVVGFLVDEDRRNTLARRLMCLLPDYVSEDRCLDAWIVQHCAILVAEPPQGGCDPFLLCMFMQALQDWQADRDQEHDGLLGEIGIDLESLRGRKPEDLDMVLRDTVSGESLAAVERFLGAHPQLKAQLEADSRAAEDAAIDLLQRDEGQALLLEREEIEPWLGLFQERILGNAAVVESTRSGKPPSKKLTRAFAGIMYEAAAEMAAGIFTENRLERLAADVQACRARLSPDDQEGLRGVVGALTAAKTRVPPDESRFLTMLCLHSVVRVVHGSSPEDAGSQPD